MLAYNQLPIANWFASRRLGFVTRNVYLNLLFLTFVEVSVVRRLGDSTFSRNPVLVDEIFDKR